MEKKRFTSHFSVNFNSKAQVTVFIIIGLILLFTSIVLITIFSSVQKSQLQDEQERLTVNLFKKEAMRIYVQDCLQDALEQGLILLGKQGHIWEDQPGGSQNFNDLTGVLFDGDRIYYGLANKEYLYYKNAYPCANYTDATPHFCEYTHPNIQIGFGDLRLKTETIRRDLEQYLINQTIVCVENFTKNNISKTAKIESTELTLSVDLREDGIGVKADYPLKFTLGGNEFFQITTFDFFYPSQFKRLLDSAITFPLGRDYRFLEFNYTHNFLNSSGYPASSIYNGLGVQTLRTSLNNGDDIFTFSPDLYSVLNSPAPYYFRLARQNRPPALDYVQRYSCPEGGYDYLVIPNDPELNSINVSLYAEDPDEDQINYTIDYTIDVSEGYWFSMENNGNMVFPGSPCTKGIISGNKWITPVKPPLNNMVKYQVQGCGSQYYAFGTHGFRAKVTDEHNLSDWQDVRVLIDVPINTNLSLALPYNDTNTFFNGAYVVSTEDPVFVNITFPGKSQAQLSQAQVNLNYSNEENSELFGFNYAFSGVQSNKSCFSLPWNGAHACNFDDYKSTAIIEQWKTYFSGEYGHFKSSTLSGRLNLSFSITYCGGELNKSTSAAADILVRECVPHRNVNRPFAYPYQNYTYSSYDFANNFGQFAGFDNSPFNPLEATHSCCGGDLANPSTWGVKGNTSVCFIDPLPGCYGGNEKYTGKTNYGNRILEVRTRYCDGTRGNVCLGDFKYDLYNNSLVCGKSSSASASPGSPDPGCSDTRPQCGGKLAFSLIKDQGWCYGKMGCNNWCSKEVVHLKADPQYSTSIYFPSETINNIARNNNITDSNEPHFYFRCGCSTNTGGEVCDANWNGNFNGICRAGACENDN